MQLTVGTPIFGKNGRTLLVREYLNRGAFGDVYLVADKETGNKMALKTVSVGALNSQELKTLENEGQLATEIVHPNVMRVLYFHDGNQHETLPPYLLMEFANGGTLKDILDERIAGKEHFSNNELFDFFGQLTEGMKAVNSQLVHRDVKPDNVLIQDGVLKISDFGLSKVAGAVTRSRTFKGISHCLYQGPEAWNMVKNTPQMDIYSMGIVFYELATLQHPYLVNGNPETLEQWQDSHLFQVPVNPSQLNKNLPPCVDEVILGMLEKSTKRRYSCWDQITHRLGSSEDSPRRPNAGVKKLVELSRQERGKKRKEEAAESLRLKKGKEREKYFRFSFREVSRVFEKVVNEFNLETDTANLQITSRTMADGYVQSLRVIGPTGKISVKCCGLVGLQHLDKEVLAWGIAEADSGLGGNVLLVRGEEDDPYGHWLLHTHTDSGLSKRIAKREPFALQEKDFKRRLQVWNAMHIFNTKEVGLTSETVAFMFQDIVGEH